MKLLLAAMLAAVGALGASVPAEAAPGALRSALRDARAPVSQLEAAPPEHSRGVTFRRFGQAVDGVPVLGSELVVTDAPGRRGDMVADRTRRVGVPRPARVPRAAALRAAMLAAGIRALRVPARASLAILASGPEPRLVWRVLAASARPLASLEILVDARSARVLRTRDLLQRANGSAWLYDPNPVVANGGTTGLADASDADSALLTSLRVPRTLPRLDTSTCLRGSFVEATLPAGDPDADTPAGDVCSVSLNFDSVTRSDNRFEALMAYFHIDRAQAYVQYLGFANVLNSRVRANVDAPIPGPPDEAGQDNSFYDLLTGELTFGTGYADDAEDAETILHEYGHAIQGAQVPDFPLGADAGAIGEGFGDYFASAMSATFAPKAGFEGCFDEWDAFASGLGDCLRRVDWGLRLGEASPDCEPADDVHCTGEVWAGALWSIRGALGGALTDRLAIQSHFSLTSSASFDQASRALLAADSALYGGVHRPQIKAVLGARGLTNVERLDDTTADATPLGLPARVGGRVTVGGDEHDVYALKLTAGRPVVFQLQISGGADADLRLLAPGTASLDAPPAARGVGRTGSRVIRHVPAMSGTYHLDVRASSGSGYYWLRTASDDSDGDGVSDYSDVCLGLSDPLQLDWNANGRGDRCDRSARVIFTGVKRTGRRLLVRARMWPATLPVKAFRLRVSKRVCTPRRCVYRPGRTRLARASSAGRLELRPRLAPGRYLLRAELRASGYNRVRSGSRRVLIPR